MRWQRRKKKNSVWEGERVKEMEKKGGKKIWREEGIKKKGRRKAILLLLCSFFNGVGMKQEKKIDRIQNE